MSKPTATLRDWHIEPYADDYRLIGYVSGHPARPAINDGDHIYTSVKLRP